MRGYHFGLSSLAMLLAAVLPLSSDAGIVYFVDGQTHTIDANNSYPSDHVHVWSDGITVITRLNLVDGGEIGTLTGGNLVLQDDSILNMTGGVVGGSVILAEDAQATISGGSADGIQAGNPSARALVWGGVTTGGIAANGGIVDVRNVDTSLAVASNGGDLILSGGSYAQGLWVHVVSTATIYGGTYGLNPHTGGGNYSLVVEQLGSLQIYGYGFNYPYGTIADLSGNLTGFLADGTPIDLPFSRAADATITLPESTRLSTVASGALLLLLLSRCGSGRAREHGSAVAASGFYKSLHGRLRDCRAEESVGSPAPCTAADSFGPNFALPRSEHSLLKSPWSRVDVDADADVDDRGCADLDLLAHGRRGHRVEASALDGSRSSSRGCVRERAGIEDRG
jgi:hypothetical protein